MYCYKIDTYLHVSTFSRFVRFIWFNRLYTKPYPNPTVFIKLYPFGLYGIYQNQTILSISVRFGLYTVGFRFIRFYTKKHNYLV